jgi:amino acid transporter
MLREHARREQPTSGIDCYSAPNRASSMIDGSSPLVILIFVGLAVAVVIVSPKLLSIRITKRPPVERRPASLGSRIMVYVGLAAICAILAFWRGSTPAFRSFWLFVIVPGMTLAIVVDLIRERRRRRSHDYPAANPPER